MAFEKVRGNQPRCDRNTVALPIELRPASRTVGLEPTTNCGVRRNLNASASNETRKNLPLGFSLMVKFLEGRGMNSRCCATSCVLMLSYPVTERKNWWF